jgi:hypothetical protein
LSIGEVASKLGKIFKPPLTGLQQFSQQREMTNISYAEAELVYIATYLLNPRTSIYLKPFVSQLVQFRKQFLALKMVAIITTI